MKFLYLILVIFNYCSIYSVNLIHKTKDIVCRDENNNTLNIEKKDNYFVYNKYKYKSVEFLDRAILAKYSNQYGLVHSLIDNKISFIFGKRFNFNEWNCEQVEYYKVCKSNENLLVWTPSQLTINGQTFPVKHYGVYPNDGTYFLAYNENELGLALIDFGSKFILIYGKHLTMNCYYRSDT